MESRPRFRWLVAVAALSLGPALNGCATRTGIPAYPTSPDLTLPAAVIQPAQMGGAKQLINHVVVVVQENRSFDNLFQGYPGANTVASAKNSKGQTIALQPISLKAFYDIDHFSSDFFAACNGKPLGRNCKMNGFDKEGVSGLPSVQNPQFGYVPASESKLYFQMAAQYVLADDMFTSHIDASFVSHQYIIAGQAEGAVDLPTGPWGCGGGPSDTVTTLNADRSYGPGKSPCSEPTTIGDELDAKGLAWRYYAAVFPDPGSYWSAYQAVGHIFNGPDWKKDVINPPARFLTDVHRGRLGAVTWVTPTCANSDHSDCQSDTGPQWVANVVNAVGRSKFWKTTTIFVMWDEWGGWYDHVKPPYVDYDGLGFRVPLLVISPYAKQGYVSHVQYEHGSILRYIEDTFGLARLAASDARANSPVPDAIDYTQNPRPFTPFATRLQARDFIAAPQDTRVPDDE